MTEDKGHLSSEQVSAFLDGELASGEASLVEHHVADCHACALRLLSATRLKAATRRALGDVVAPPEALNRLAAQLRQPAPKRTARLYALRSLPLAAAAAALILTISLFGWRQTRPSNDLAAELLDQHLAVLSNSAQPEVVSTDRHTVKPWFQGKLPFSFNLPEALPEGTILRGGDFTFLHGQPAALLLFAIHKHEVSVFLTQRSGDLNTTSPGNGLSGFTIRTATTQDLRITAVSDVNPADLDRLVAALVKAQ